MIKTLPQTFSGLQCELGIRIEVNHRHAGLSLDCPLGKRRQLGSREVVLVIDGISVQGKWEDASRICFKVSAST